jgi:aminopeptidase N
MRSDKLTVRPCLSTGAQLAKASDISYDKKSERVTFKFPQEIAPQDIVLSVNFTGTMNDAMAGFYRSKYKPVGEPAADTPKEGDFSYMLSTQFESCDARRAFPCFDEPNLKAAFDFEIEVPKQQTALSNMPIKSERDGSRSGLKFVTFEKTPVMSTYVSIPDISVDGRAPD